MKEFEGNKVNNELGSPQIFEENDATIVNKGETVRDFKFMNKIKVIKVSNRFFETLKNLGQN